MMKVYLVTETFGDNLSHIHNIYYKETDSIKELELLVEKHNSYTGIDGNFKPDTYIRRNPKSYEQKRSRHRLMVDEWEVIEDYRHDLVKGYDVYSTKEAYEKEAERSLEENSKKSNYKVLLDWKGSYSLHYLGSLFVKILIAGAFGWVVFKICAGVE